ETRFDATLCWMNEQPLDPNTAYVLMHTTRQVQAFVTEVVYRIDVDTLHREDAATLGLNDVGRVEITTSAPIFFDPYAQNTQTGSFILVDPHTHLTMAAGMIRGEIKEPPTPVERAPAADARAASRDVVWEGWNVPREEREARNGHGAVVLWFTGLSGSGKSTIARALERALFEAGCRTMLLDGDQLRHGLCADLGFSDADRRENIRRVGEVARLFFEQGSIVLCTFVSPFRADRDRVRSLLPESRFVEIHVDADLETCMARDPKGLYARALRGEVAQFTGVSSPYEAPEAPELVLRSGEREVPELVAQVVAYLREAGIFETR
ncbi:MAG TPA: adenylyl-sulfate kinase, partial [Gemmatimonadaceae bacterium]|nr:adenylyl-sulfate kinase [Gemmatimonadaceae bacterium]